MNQRPFGNRLVHSIETHRAAAFKNITACAHAAGESTASSRLMSRSRHPQVLRSRGVCPSCRIRSGPDAVVVGSFIVIG